MKKLLFSIVLLAPLSCAGLLVSAPFSTPAFAQQLTIYCNQSTTSPCNTTSNTGTGSSGDPFWLGMGKTNYNFNLLFPTSGVTTGYVWTFNGTNAGWAAPGNGITQLTGDVTAGPGTGSQAATLAASGVTAGSYTSANITVDSKGRVTAAANGSGGGTPANPTATAGPTAINGSATTYMRSDAAPAVQTATTGQLGLVKPDGTTITISAGVITASGGSATTITPGTTTIGGATAPCTIENTTSTTMGCVANTGTGNNVHATSPTLVAPVLGAATVTSINGNTVPSASDTVALLAATQTLTNKSISGSQINSGTVPVAQLPVATTGANGVVKPDGTTITISGGVISASGGAPAFSAVTAGTNTNALVVGTGGSLATSGSGTIAASSLTALSGLPAQAANTIVCNGTSSSASPTACSAATAIGALTSGTPNPQTGTTYALLIGDANGEVTMANASANTLTVPTNASVPFNVGTVSTTQQLSTGTTSFSTSGLTIQSPGLLNPVSLGGEFGFEQLQKVATNTWNVIAYAPGDATFTVSGGTCTTPTSLTGGNTGGIMTAASAGNCTIIVTPGGGLTAKELWVGSMADRTQPTVPSWHETASSTTTITFTVPTAVASSDVLTFLIQAE